MIVCTLCSCYPWEMLGLPPVWYKAAPYRSRAVNDPRGVLDDFGVTLPEGTNIRVWDSTAETRFIVLPMRPAGTEGWSEEKLAELVTRDSMIGTGLAKEPGAVAALTLPMTRALRSISAFLAGQIADAETQWSLGHLRRHRRVRARSGRAGRTRVRRRRALGRRRRAAACASSFGRTCG